MLECLCCVFSATLDNVHAIFEHGFSLASGINSRGNRELHFFILLG